MGKMSRTKGKVGEREVINALQPLVEQAWLRRGLPPDRVPLLQRNTLQSDKGGIDIAGLPWLALEVKRCETLAVAQWWQQCVKQADALPAYHTRQPTPVLIYRQNGRSWSVVMKGQLVAGWRWQTVVVTIGFEEFKSWFTLRLEHEFELLTKR